MKSIAVRKSLGSVQGSKGRKPYVAPSIKCLSSEMAKELLLRRADVRDPNLGHMLDRIEGTEVRQASKCAETARPNARVRSTG
jgi:hypothetical protein